MADQTYQCKWCGTRFCRECMKGDFTGVMFEALRCRRCNQIRCQGVRVEYVPGSSKPDEDGNEDVDKKGRGKLSAKKKSTTSKGSKTKTKGKKKGGKKKKKK